MLCLVQGLCTNLNLCWRNTISETTSRWTFVTGSARPQMAVNTIPEQERDEQTALIKSRVQVTDEEIAALPDRVRQRMAAAFGWLPKYGAPSTGYRTASAMVTDGHPGFAPRPKVLLSKAERERLEQTWVTGLPRPSVLVTAQERVAAALLVTDRLERPKVLVNKRDR